LDLIATERKILPSQDKENTEKMYTQDLNHDQNVRKF